MNKDYFPILSRIFGYSSDIKDREDLLNQIKTDWRLNGTMNSPYCTRRIEIIQGIDERLRNAAISLGIINDSNKINTNRIKELETRFGLK